MQNYRFRSPQGFLRWGFLGVSLFLFPSLTLPVQETTLYDYPVIDAYARATPERYTHDLNTLAAYLTAPARSELGKARSIYTWILTHIRYDNASSGNGFYTSDTEYATRVLKTRKAVCTGFALLFKCLLVRAGVDVRNVKGYARTQDSDAGMPVRRMSHEWNAVSLDGDWYLFDLTWAENTARDNQSNDYYFLTNPETFVAGHFPADPRWQLLSPAVSKAEFDHYPKIYDSYFRLGFDPDFPRNGLLRAGETVTISLDHPSAGFDFTCMVGQRGYSRSVPVQIERVENTYQLTIPIAQRGTSMITIFGGSKGKGRPQEALLVFTAVRN